MIKLVVFAEDGSLRKVLSQITFFGVTLFGGSGPAIIAKTTSGGLKLGYACMQGLFYMSSSIRNHWE